MTEVGRRERETEREAKMRGTCERRARRYIKRPITINSEDAVYRGGTRKGVNPRELSADTGDNETNRSFIGPRGTTA